MALPSLLLSVAAYVASYVARLLLAYCKLLLPSLDVVANCVCCCILAAVKCGTCKSILREHISLQERASCLLWLTCNASRSVLGFACTQSAFQLTGSIAKLEGMHQKLKQSGMRRASMGDAHRYSVWHCLHCTWQPLQPLHCLHAVCYW